MSIKTPEEYEVSVKCWHMLIDTVKSKHVSRETAMHAYQKLIELTAELRLYDETH